MTGRPATTVEGQVRAMVRRLGSVQGAMDPASRMSVMEALIRNARTDLKYNGRPSRELLVRLAAHAIAWADEGEDE